ncbi:MAG: hypothetical protein HYS13_05660 [Planctomycetia bacterium]|nr:hypothetical protein [Planctomycetia bacterium]
MATVSDGRMACTREERVTFVKGQYERLWDNVCQRGEEILKQGETDLARVVQLMRRERWQDFPDPYLREKYKKKEEERRRSGFLYDRRHLPVYDVDPRVIVKMLDAVKMQEIVNLCGSDVKRVVETGSGWGKTLFNVWLHGGPRDAEYRALEITEAGRKTTELIASRCAPGMDMKAHFFDYFESDFSCLKGDKPTLVYTHHSIEQVPQLGENFVDAVLAIPGFRCCVHLEPVGWQVPSTSWLRRPRSRRTMRHIDDLNRKFTLKHNQNQNLYPLLLDMERRGKIRITVVRKHFCSTLLHNTTTLIVWERPEGEPRSAIRRDDLPQRRMWWPFGASRAA